MCPRRKTKIEFVNEMKISHPTIQVLGNYYNNKTNIKCKCQICGNIWMPRPDQLVRGQGCPKCGLNQRIKTQSKTHSKFIDEMKIINPEIEVVGKYINNHQKLQLRCLKCKTEWNTTPNLLLSHKSGCPKCNGHILKTQSQYEKEMIEKHPKIKILGKYVQNKVPVEVMCTNCGNIWNSYPLQAIYKNVGCPRCEKRYKGEVKISDYLDILNIKYKTQMTYDGLIGVNGGKLRYDFYLPKFNLLIEYQGNFHDKSGFVGDFFSDERFNIQKEHDKRKREYAKNHNIDLLEIWYWDFDNIEKILDKII